MKNNDKKALDILSDQIIKAIETMCLKLEFNKTYSGIISSINDDGYTIKYNGTEINIKSAAIDVLKKNDMVKFCIPCGNKRKAYIVVDLDLANKLLNE